MRKVWWCVALLTAFVVEPAIALPPLDPNDGAIFPEDRAKNLVDQCSRASPVPLEGIWLPDQKQIKELEARLPNALDDALAKRGEYQDRYRDFARQYAGFVIHGRKIIYVNAFPRGMIDENKRFAALRNKPEPDWHRDAEHVCDGGPAFFGVEYDPEAKTFSHFEFNGLA
jgi:hypothetical protein